MGKLKKKIEFTREGYLKAKVLHSLSSFCHDQGLLFGDLGNEEMADVYADAHGSLADEARKLFPLYPHPDFIAGQEWARAQGFNE